MRKGEKRTGTVAEAARPLTAEHEAYIDWLCTPQHLRVPSNKNEYAESTGTTYSTLNRWEKLPLFVEARQRRQMATWGDAERLQALFEAVYKEGMNGSVRHAELVFRMAGVLNPKPVETVDPAKTAADLSDEELDALFQAELEAEKKRRG